MKPGFRIGCCAALVLAATGQASAQGQAGPLGEQLVALLEEAALPESGRFSVLAELRGAAASIAARRMTRALTGRRLTVSFDGWDVEEALVSIHRSCGVPIVIGAKARKALEADRPKLRLAVRDLRPADILDLMIEQLGGFRLAVRSGALVLLRKEEYRPRRLLRIHDVRDLLRPRPDFPAPALGTGLLAEDERP